MMRQGSVIARTEFSCAGCEWQDSGRRPVIAVPGLMYALVSNTAAGSWAFHLEWDQLWRNRSLSWGFVRHNLPLPQASDADAFERGSKYGMRAAGEVYDLHGFLRCMADEGRPCPSPDLAAKLEALLYAKAEGEGTLICP